MTELQQADDIKEKLEKDYPELFNNFEKYFSFPTEKGNFPDEIEHFAGIIPLFTFDKINEHLQKQFLDFKGMIDGYYKELNNPKRL